MNHRDGTVVCLVYVAIVYMQCTHVACMYAVYTCGMHVCSVHMWHACGITNGSNPDVYHKSLPGTYPDP